MPILALLAAAVIPAGQSFACTPVRLWDGDGPIWCAEGAHVRVSGIAAREMDGICRPGHPCADATAERSRDALAALVGRVTGRAREGHLLVTGPTMRCISEGGAGGTRTAAWCVSPIGGDLSCAMVRGGWAVRWAKFWRKHRCS